MTKTGPKLPAGRELLLVFAASLAAVLVFSGNPLSLSAHSLRSSYLPDDAFYGFKIARYIARGRGWTFDGLHPTNGAQPLWTWLITPLFSAADPIAPIRWTLLLGYLFFAAGAVFLYRLARRWLSPTAAVLIWAYWILSPGNRLIDTHLNGMETALYLSMLWLWLERLAAGAGDLEMGVWTVVCILSRLDALLLAGVYGLWILSGLLRREDGRKVLRRAVVFSLPSLAAVPYFVWNYVRFGSIQPISGIAKHMKGTRLLRLTFARGGLGAAWRGFAAYLTLNSFPSGLLQSASRAALRPFAAPAALEPAAATCALVGMLALAAATFLWARRRQAWLSQPAARVALAFFALLFVVYRVDYPAHTGDWHGAPFLIFSTLMVACWLEGLFASGLPAAWRKPAAAAVVLALLGEAAARRPETAPIPGEDAFLSWVAQRLPAQARLGAFDAGAVGYFSPQTVVDLDGLVNSADLLPYIKEGRVDEYVCAQGIDYLVDPAHGGNFDAELSEYGDMSRWRAILEPVEPGPPDGVAYRVRCSR